MTRGIRFPGKFSKLLVALPLVLPILFVSGCHTINPNSYSSPELINQIEKTPNKVTLVLDNKLRNYQSRDRGHLLADPQVIKVGQALAPLAEAYFEAAFSYARVVNSFPDRSLPETHDGIIMLKIMKFDNRLSAVGIDQEIMISLSAEVYDQSGKRAKEIHVHGIDRGVIPLMGSVPAQAKITSNAIQDGLVNLVGELKKYFESRMG